jgi:AcrR family transcriptional regulator
VASQAERRAATRKRLIEAGHALFVSDGYDATSTDALLAHAEVSKGAMYHHFASKQELFAAVYEQVAQASLARALRGQRPGSSELDTLVEGCTRWLREARKPEVATILLEQGPRVLGFAGARDLEARTSLPLMKRGLERAVEAGEIELDSVDLAARLVNAMLGEAALASLGNRRRPSRSTIERTVRRFIEGLGA